MLGCSKIHLAHSTPKEFQTRICAEIQIQKILAHLQQNKGLHNSVHNRGRRFGPGDSPKSNQYH